MGIISVNQRLINGFTLLELIVTLAIVGITMSIAVPSLGFKVDENRVIGAAEQIYQDLLYARSEAVKSNSDITLSFTQNSSWCYGINATGVCDCGSAGSCTINGKNKTGSYEDYSNTSLTVSSNINGANFDPSRGVIEKTNSPVTGSITITGVNVSATINMNVLGRPSICSNDFSKYPSC